jgi:hypothetical protein
MSALDLERAWLALNDELRASVERTSDRHFMLVLIPSDSSIPIRIAEDGVTRDHDERRSAGASRGRSQSTRRTAKTTLEWAIPRASCGPRANAVSQSDGSADGADLRNTPQNDTRRRSIRND